MPPGLNKKVLVFVDEYGTAGQGALYLGAIFVLARDAGRLDKRCSAQPRSNQRWSALRRASELDG